MERLLTALARAFRSTKDKFEGHRRATPILAAATEDHALIGELLRLHIRRPGVWNRTHYPVLGIDVALNADFGLVGHCWLPLPTRATDLSTKAIHHHGNMLLSTVNIFGPKVGYEHWTFTYPLPIDRSRDLYAMELRSRAQHTLGNVDFVPDHTPHVPMYMPGTMITLALWTNRAPTGWRDRLKRVDVVKRRAGQLKQAAVRLGLTAALDLKVVENFDFYPSAEGFVGMRERQEFAHGPNADYLRSLFHMVQKTGHESLGALLEERFRDERPNDAALVRALLDDLAAGREVAPVLSPSHTGIAHANFTRAQIERSLAASRVGAARPIAVANAAATVTPPRDAALQH